MSPRDKAIHVLDALTGGVRQVVTRSDVSNSTVSTTAATLFALAGTAKLLGFESVSGYITASGLILFSYAAVNEYGLNNTKTYFTHMYSALFSKGQRLGQAAPNSDNNSGYVTPEEHQEYDDKPKMQ